MNSPTGPASQQSIFGSLRKILGRAYRALAPAEDRCRQVLHAAAFAARALLIRLGLSRPQRLVLNSEVGSADEGFFAKFTVVLGLLAHYEKWRFAIAGVRVDFGDRGLYFDHRLGNNWWEYHFEPIDLRSGARAAERNVRLLEEDRFAAAGERMSRKCARELISRYIHVRPRVESKIEAFVQSNFTGFHVLGIHYRGTDKSTEVPRVPYEEVSAAVRVALDAAGAEPVRIFVASDEQAFVDYAKRTFPERVVAWRTQRSLDGRPIDIRDGDNLTKGEDALIDCLLLSRCDSLIRTPSHLGKCSTLFNPDLPVELLTGSHPYQGPL